jgi:hypothetical protein
LDNEADAIDRLNEARVALIGAMRSLAVGERSQEVDELLCNRCKTRLLAESAVSVVVEVRIGRRMVERLQFFDLHRACANLAVGPEINKRKKKYVARDVVSVRHELAANSPDLERTLRDNA